MKKSSICVNTVPLFNHLTHQEQALIHAKVRSLTVQKGETVMSPITEPRLIIVAEGRLSVYQLSPNGKEQMVYLVNEGDYIGEHELFGVKNDVRYGRALEQSQICILTQSDFEGLLLQFPKLSLKLLQLNAQKLALSDSHAQYILLEHIAQRLALYLMNLFEAAQSSVITIPMMYKELATFLATTPETLSRTIKQFEDETIIKRKSRTITLISKEKLISKAH